MQRAGAAKVRRGSAHAPTAHRERRPGEGEGRDGAGSGRGQVRAEAGMEQEGGTFAPLRAQERPWVPAAATQPRLLRRAGSCPRSVSAPCGFFPCSFLTPALPSEGRQLFPGTCAGGAPGSRAPPPARPSAAAGNQEEQRARAAGGQGGQGWQGRQGRDPGGQGGTGPVTPYGLRAKDASGSGPLGAGLGHSLSEASGGNLPACPARPGLAALPGPAAVGRELPPTAGLTGILIKLIPGGWQEGWQRHLQL